MFPPGQHASSTEYVSTTMNGDFTVFGVNFADGRIKGYGTVAPNGSTKTFHIRYVRRASGYGVNDFANGGDGTITDRTTGLMWSQQDSGTGMSWQQALLSPRSATSATPITVTLRLDSTRSLTPLPDSLGTSAMVDLIETLLTGRRRPEYYQSRAGRGALWIDSPRVDDRL